MDRNRWREIGFQERVCAARGISREREDLFFPGDLQSSVQGYGAWCAVESQQLGRIDVCFKQRCISVDLKMMTI
jgi:hypothetical protein